MNTLSQMERLINQINPNVDLIEAFDFASAAEDERIHVGHSFDEDFAQVIRDVYNKVGIHFHCSLETFALLHELGHIETLKDLHEEDYEDLMYHYAVGVDQSKMADTDFGQFYAYVNLPIEQMANDWAVTFIETHPSFVTDLDRIMVQYQKELDDMSLSEYMAKMIISKVV